MVYCNAIGYPMGPIELADYVGLDINKFVLDGELGIVLEQ